MLPKALEAVKNVILYTLNRIQQVPNIEPFIWSASSQQNTGNTIAMCVMSTLVVMTATEAVRFSNSAILLGIYLLTSAYVPIKVFLRGSTLYCDQFPQSLK